jgi:hypothetical protein
MVLPLKIITKTGGTFQPFLFPLKIILKEDWNLACRFDKDDVMYCNTAYGDYPTYLPQYAQGKDFTKGLFAGWMLLNYNKPVQVSSTLGGYQPNYAVDEDIKTYWSAKQEIQENGSRPIWERFPPSMPFRSIMQIRMLSLWGKP